MKKQRSPSITDIAKKYHIDLLYLFGSTARGDRHAGSDVDIAYHAPKLLNPREHLKLITALGSLRMIPSGEIDLVALNRAPSLLQYQVLTEGKKLYGSDRADDRFYRSTLKQYIDAKPIFNATAEYVHTKIGFKNTRSPKK